MEKAVGHFGSSTDFTSALVRDSDGNLLEITQIGDMVGEDSNG